MAWKGLSYFKSGTKFRSLEHHMTAVPPHKHRIKNFSGARYKKTYAFFIIVHFLGFGLAVFILGNQWSPVKQCINATVKFANMKEMTLWWNLAPSARFCCLTQLPEKYNHAACRGKTILCLLLVPSSVMQPTLLYGLVAPPAAREVKCTSAIKKQLDFS